MFTAGGDYSATPKTKAMCACTDHGHQAVREAIVNNKLLTIADVFTVSGVEDAQWLRHLAARPSTTT